MTTTQTPSRAGGKASSSEGKFLTFNLGRESYGIAVIKVREIIRPINITAVPETPVYVKGVINLRGKVIPVVDLRLRFELPETADAGRMCIVVVQVDLGAAAETLMGLVVDGVEEVANIAASDIEPPPDFGASFDAAHLLGMAKTKNGVKILLDIDKVLRPDDIAPILNCAQN